MSVRSRILADAIKCVILYAALISVKPETVSNEAAFAIAGIAQIDILAGETDYMALLEDLMNNVDVNIARQ